MGYYIFHTRNINSWHYYYYVYISSFLPLSHPPFLTWSPISSYRCLIAIMGLGRKQPALPRDCCRPGHKRGKAGSFLCCPEYVLDCVLQWSLLITYLLRGQGCRGPYKGSCTLLPGTKHVTSPQQVANLLDLFSYLVNWPWSLSSILIVLDRISPPAGGKYMIPCST